MTKINREALVEFGVFVLELMGRGKQFDKDDIVTHCENGDIVDYLILAFENNFNNLHMPEPIKEYINENFFEFISTAELSREGNRPDQSIYDSKTQGLNALLFTIIYYLENF